MPGPIRPDLDPDVRSDSAAHDGVVVRSGSPAARPGTNTGPSRSPAGDRGSGSRHPAWVEPVEAPSRPQPWSARVRRSPAGETRHCSGSVWLGAKNQKPGPTPGPATPGPTTPGPRSDPRPQKGDQQARLLPPVGRTGSGRAGRFRCVAVSGPPPSLDPPADHSVHEHPDVIDNTTQIVVPYNIFRNSLRALLDVGPSIAAVFTSASSAVLQIGPGTALRGTDALAQGRIASIESGPVVPVREKSALTTARKHAVYGRTSARASDPRASRSSQAPHRHPSSPAASDRRQVLRASPCSPPGRWAIRILPSFYS